MEQMVNYVLLGAMGVLAVCMLLCLIRALIGPRLADRIVAINMIGTQVLLFICLLAVYLGEGGLVDIAILYAMLSFLAVVVATRIYIVVFEERRRKGRGEK